ncbi:MAG: Heparinase family protein [Actinomycetia bacterium]|nr:Heparinase family protein [Actinomycetes bacterium]
MNRGEFALLARTAAHLQPSQVTQRARLRAQRAALRRFPPARHWLLAGPDPGAAAGWPARFSPLDARVWRNWPGFGALRQGRIELLGMTRVLTSPASMADPSGDQSDPADADWAEAHWTAADWEQADWEQAGAPSLWRFHLHYWDWAWRLASEPDRADARAWFAAMWRSWHVQVAAGRGDAWLPYPAALRAWSYCGLHRDLVAGSQIEASFMADLSAHAGFLRRNLELDVGGNHLIKNLKALAGLAVFFGDARRLGQALDQLTSQLAVQVLPDGGHYERAPAYHCQVLADLVDVAELVRCTGQVPAPELLDAIDRMRSWMRCVLAPDGQVPLLNDGYPVDPELVAALRPGLPPAEPLLVLPDSGLVRAAAGSWRLLADVGAPCPDELPAHAHADTLSCLVQVGGIPLLVDTGTSTYTPGPVRNYERSTAAHNTLEVDGADSTEVWGAFRAARRAQVTDLATCIAHGGVLTAEAVHDGYRRLPGRPVHRRRWMLTETGLRVEDYVTGRGRHAAVVRWHLAPGSELQLNGAGAVVTSPAGEFRVTVSATGPITLATETGQVASGFSRTVGAPVLACRVTTVLPVQISTSWQQAGGREQAAGGREHAEVSGRTTIGGTE